MAVGDYFTRIGLSYLVIPIYACGMGYILARKAS